MTFMETTTHTHIELEPDEIALFSYLAWERDGRPPGKSLDYWLDAERQLRATRASLVEELKTTRQKSVAFTRAGGVKAKVSAKAPSRVASAPVTANKKARARTSTK